MNVLLFLPFFGEREHGVNGRSSRDVESQAVLTHPLRPSRGSPTRRPFHDPPGWTSAAEGSALHLLAAFSGTWSVLDQDERPSMHAKHGLARMVR